MNINFSAFVAILVVFCGSLSHGAETQNKYEVYHKLIHMYGKWQKGFVGSRSHHRKKLEHYLWTLHGRYFLSDNSFVLKSPEGVLEPAVESPLVEGKWLEVRGPLDRESFFKTLGGDGLKLKSLWRTGNLVQIYGRIRRAYLGKGPCGDLVILELYKVYPGEIDETEKSVKAE